MSDVKQVKVDNWGIYFLQRLKNFFNRTDYCDLTLQFQDNAQLKVHRLVLNACTEYFELLERTCEMYEDCLIMPDDLQADVVVPIVNFMYTGQLEFRMDILEKLYQTSQIMNMPVLTKLLDSHRVKPAQKYSSVKRYSKASESKNAKPATPIASTSNKRSYSKAFDSNKQRHKDQTVYITKPESKTSTLYHSPSTRITTHSVDLPATPKRTVPVDPRPTRYELPEELDTDNVFDNSFTSISYASQPLMVHPETVKQYSSKRPGIFNDSKGPKLERLSTVDIVECKKVANNNSNIFDDDDNDNITDDTDMYQSPFIKTESAKMSNQLFDQILDDGPKMTIETKDSKSVNNIDHAKIISEVLKKYPHLVKNNKVIKLKVLNTPNKSTLKKQVISPKFKEPIKTKTESEPDFTYEVDVLDSKEAAKLIALGADNIRGPWICLICGTPGKALHFTSYYKFRRHLVDVHNEKPVMNICEYCGMKSAKRNCLLHHLYSKHGVEPPPTHHFPKCNQCSYIGLTEALLVKHKLSHVEGRNFRCNVCDEVFNSSQRLLQHIQSTGHKYSAERKANLQCIYCLKVFLRQTNLYAHLKTNHRDEAKKDGIIDDSDDEIEKPKSPDMKCEPVANFNNEYDEIDVQYKIQQRPDGNIQLVAKKQSDTPSKQKILNADFSTPPKPAQKAKVIKNSQSMHNEFLQNVTVSSNKEEEEIVVIDSNEYIVRDNLLIPKPCNSQGSEEYILPSMMDTTSDHTIQTVTPTTSMEYTSIHTTTVDGNVQQPNMIIKNSTNLNQPIQIVVSNEEEYKALMSSNHPIIFDNSDSSKTLTVLTAPHATSLGTIDMNNTQSNDMMIIQENYPLNVSEAMATDNSNIVVVYSHHINQDKQFQLLAPEGVDEQFVQSSTILTQNYETITTSTPVMSAHVLETAVAETWQQDNNHQTVPNEQSHMSTGAEIQTIQQEIPQTENVTDISELPEVQLQLSAQKSIDEVENTVDNNLNQNNNIIIQHVQATDQEESVESIKSVSAPMEIVQSPINETVQKEIDTTEPAASSEAEDNIQEMASNIDSEMVEMQTCDEMQPQTEIDAEQISDETIEQQDNIEATNIDDQNSNIETTTDVETAHETVDEAQPDLQENEISDISITVPINKPEPAVEAETKIQAFTSEWSEDEYDTATLEQNKANGATLQDEKLPVNIEQSIPQNAEGADNQPEDEESIENIQQEIENQMAIIPAATPDVDESLVDSPKEDNSTIYTEGEESLPPVETNGNVVVPQENISSILNDWDDNDSQEDKENSINDDAETSGVPETPPAVTNNSVEEDNLPEKSAPKPDVKSLVSDWDDDEEEENKT